MVSILKKMMVGASLLIISSLSISAQNLLENPNFKPVVYEGTPSGAPGWLFYDWTRRKLMKDNNDAYYSGFDFYKLNFIKNGLIIDTLWSMPTDEITLTLQDNTTFILPMAPEFKLTGEVLITKGSLTMSLAGVRKEFKSSPNWQKLDISIKAKDYFSSGLKFRPSIIKGAKFGVRDLDLCAIYPDDSGEIHLPGDHKLQSIAIPVEATFKEQYVALLWQGYFWKLSGKVLKIERTNSPQAGSLVLKGGEKQYEKKGGYHLTVDDKGICFTAFHPDTFYAAMYNYLRTLGVRFYTTDTFTFPAKNEKLQLKAIDKTFTPKFPAVYHHSPNAQIGFSSILNGGLSLNTFRPRSNDWYENVFPYGFHATSFLLPYSKYGMKHPEFYQMDKFGKRQAWDDQRRWQLCLRNSESTKLLADRLKLWMDSQKEYRDFSFEADDGETVCQCPECKKHAEGDSNSNNMFWYLNQIAKQIPDRKISTLAYTIRTEAPPTTETLEKNINVTYCTWPTDWKCGIHTDCEYNKEGIEHVKKWAELMKDDPTRLSFYIYPHNTLSSTMDMLKFLDEHGDGYLFLCLDYEYDMMYMITRWNWGDAPEKALEEFYKGFYGAGSEKMLKFNHDLETFCQQYRHQPMDGSKQKVRTFPYLITQKSIFTQPQFDSFLTTLDEALAAEPDDSIYRQRILYIKAKVLAQYIATFPLSSCGTEQDLVAFGKRLSNFIKTCEEQFNSPIPATKQWPLSQMKTAIFTHKPQRFFQELAGVPITTLAGNWPQDPKLQDFIKDPSQYLTFQPEKIHNDHTGYRGSIAGLEWGPKQMSGGAGTLTMHYRCPSRKAAVIRRPSSGQNEIKAQFSLTKVPKAPILLEIVGQDDDKPKRADWKVTINGNALTEGPNPFVENDWSTYACKFPAKDLKFGKNIITITNTTPDPPADNTKKKEIYDANGTFLGTAKTQDYTYGWIAINAIRLCESPDDQTAFVVDELSSQKTEKFKPVFIHPNKTYHLKALAKGSDELSVKILLLDGNAKPLKAPRVNQIEGSLTELLRPCEKGDTSIIVKDASNWKTGPYFAAFNTNPKPAVSLSAQIIKISQEGTDWKIEFAKPLTIDYHEGMNVACGIGGPNGLSKRFNLTDKWENIDFSFTSEELLKNRPGAIFFYPMFLGKNVEVKNCSIASEKTKYSH